MTKNRVNKPVFIDRNEINRKLDKVKGNVTMWLDEKRLLEAEMLAQEGMYEHPNVNYWTED